MDLFVVMQDFVFKDDGQTLADNKIEKGSVWKLVGYNNETIVVACLKSLNLNIDGATIAFKRDIFNRYFGEVRHGSQRFRA